MNAKTSVYQLALSPDDQHLFCVGKGGKGKKRVVQYELGSFREVRSYDNGHTDSVFCLALSQTGKTLFTGGADYRIISWSTETGQILKEFLTGHNACVQDLALARDETNLYSCGRDGKVNRWNVDSGKLMASFEAGHSEWVACLTLSKTSLHLFSGGGDKKIIQWRALEGRKAHEFPQAHSEGVYALKLTLEEDFLVSGGGDSLVLLWDVKSRRVLKKLRGHEGQVRALVLSADNKFLVSGSKDQRVRVWKLGFLEVFRRLNKVLEAGDYETAKQILGEQLTTNNDLSELHEFYYLAGKFPVDYDQKLALRILEKFREEVDRLESQETDRPEVKASLAALLEKCYEVLSRANGTLATLGQYDIKEVALDERMQQLQDDLGELKQLRQFKLESEEKVRRLREALDQKQEESENKELLGNQLDSAFTFLQQQRGRIFKSFRGELQEGLKTGLVREETYDGELFEGQYKKGKRNGQGFLKTQLYSFEGNFRNDRPQLYSGVVIHFDPDGTQFEKQFKDILNYLGEFRGRTIHGRGTIYFRNGGFFEGEFVEDEINGAILGTLTLEREDESITRHECCYGYFQAQNVGRFTTLTQSFSCDFKTGELVRTIESESEPE